MNTLTALKEAEIKQELAWNAWNDMSPLAFDQQKHEYEIATEQLQVARHAHQAWQNKVCGEYEMMQDLAADKIAQLKARVAELETAMSNAARNQASSNEENRQLKTALKDLINRASSIDLSYLKQVGEEQECELGEITRARAILEKR